jgi:hypothetical protein
MGRSCHGAAKFAKCSCQRKTDLSESDNCDHFHDVGFLFLLWVLAQAGSWENATILMGGEQEDEKLALLDIDLNKGWQQDPDQNDS